jgi:hypothetical protein
MNSTAPSPLLLSQIMGSAQIGDLAVEVRELGAAGMFELGSVMARDSEGKMILARDDIADDVYGILCEERWVIDIASERRLDVPIARRGSFKAEMLHVADGSSLRTMVGRLRELGCYLEGIEATYAPPFRIRALVPTFATAGDTNIRIRVMGDGTFKDTARIWYNGAEITTNFEDYTALNTVLATSGGVGVYLVQVRDGTERSNVVNFEIRPAP